jgi:hypothetical protein
MRLVCAAFAAAQEPARRRPPARGVPRFRIRTADKETICGYQRAAGCVVDDASPNNAQLKMGDPPPERPAIRGSNAIAAIHEATIRRNEVWRVRGPLVTRCEDSTAATRMREANRRWVFVFSGSGRWRDVSSQLRRAAGRARLGGRLSTVAIWRTSRRRLVASGPSARVWDRRCSTIALRREAIWLSGLSGWACAHE